MTTTEGNRLIAEFMGGEVSEYSVQFNPPQNGVSWPVNNDLSYHSDWNWLMPVVEKIETIIPRISITTFAVLIEHDKDNPILKFPTSKGDDFKREATWLAVVEFIEWYNKQK